MHVHDAIEEYLASGTAVAGRIIHHLQWQYLNLGHLSDTKWCIR